jgi:hypothetical protein
VAVNGSPVLAAPGQYALVEREWHTGDRLQARLPMRPGTHRASNRNVQESRAPDGSAIRQEVLREDFLAISRGPLVYATGLIDGFKTTESIRLPEGDESSWLQELPPSAGSDALRIALTPLQREAIVFEPYFSVAGRADGAWRLTWMALAPDPLTQ